LFNLRLQKFKLLSTTAVCVVLVITLLLFKDRHTHYFYTNILYQLRNFRVALCKFGFSSLICNTSFAGLILSFAGLILSFAGLILSFAGLIVSFAGLILSFQGLILPFEGLMLSFAGLILSFAGLILSFAGLILSFEGLILSFERLILKENVCYVCNVDAFVSVPEVIFFSPNQLHVHLNDRE